MNKEKFKELPFKKKLQWLVQYYGVVALISIIAVFIVINLVKSILFPAPAADVCIMILNDNTDTEKSIEMQYELSKDLECKVEVSAYMPSDPYGMQSFATRVMSDQLDIVIAPKDEMEDMLSTSYIQEYDQIGDSDVYIATPEKARVSEKQEKAIEYLRNKFSEKNS